MGTLLSLLCENEVAAIDAYSDDAQRRHPAWSAMHAYNRHVDYERSPKDHLVNEAIKHIINEKDGCDWLETVKKRFVQTTSFEDATAALAEIRCYGAMLEGGFAVRPIPRRRDVPTPDFEFELGGTIGIVEVAAKLEDDAQVVRAREIAEGGTPVGVERSTVKVTGGRIDFTTSESHPFGAPDSKKRGDTTQTNAISRICAIKGKETQVTVGKPGLLWIDFRDLGRWPGAFDEVQAAPLIRGHDGRLCSGAIWYAFYGWKGAPVSDDGIGTPILMAHDGRFYAQNSKPSRYSAAIICLEKATILLENPVAQTPLTDAQRAALTKLPSFNLQYSVANWHSGDVDRAHSLAQSMIDALHKDQDSH